MASDLDVDGRVDIVATHSSSDDGLTVFFQDAGRAFSTHPFRSPLIDSPQSLCAGDFDDDGMVDLVSANSDSDNLGFFFKRDEREFSPALSLPIGESCSSVASADFDRDGDFDVVSGDEFELTVLFQAARGAFVARSDRLGGANIEIPAAVVAKDIDGDGDVDVVSANENSDNLTIFWGGR